MVIVNKVGEMDEGRSCGGVGVDGVRVRSLDLIFISKPNLLFLGEFDEGVCGDEFEDCCQRAAVSGSSVESEVLSDLLKLGLLLLSD